MTIRYGSERAERISRRSERDDKVSEQQLKAKGLPHSSGTPALRRPLK